MPYPNPTDPELQERMRFMDDQQQQLQQHASRPVPMTAEPGTSGAAAVSSHAHDVTKAGMHSASQVKRGQAAGITMTAGREYYEDLCMKAVNQCVGRVIRHRNDYAAVVLADARWCHGNTGVVQGSPKTLTGPLRKLPDWVQGSLTVCKSFGDAYGRLHRFHRQMQIASSQ